MIIVAGLGNPGQEYANTRHNIGYMLVDELAKRNNIDINRVKFDSFTREVNLFGEKVILLKPITYMNNSGIAIKKAVAFYKIPLENLLIIYDDIDIDFASIRIRKKGSSGTHNGMKSVIKELNSTDFPRIRIGVGKKPQAWDLADFVLSDFTKEEKIKIDKAIIKAADAVETFIKDGIDKAMNLYND